MCRGQIPFAVRKGSDPVLLQPGFKGRHQPPGLRPGRVQRAVGHAVHARAEGLPFGGMVAEVLQAVAIGQQQIERGIGASHGRQSVDMHSGRVAAAQEVGHQRAPRRAGLGRQRVADVGDHRHPARGANPGPATAGAQVAPADDERLILPGGQRRRRAGVELITVAGHHQPPARVVHPAKSEQAHGLIVHGLRSPAPFPARSG